MKKYFFLLFFFSSALLLSWSGGGIGTENSPYLIWGKNHLKELNDSLKYFFDSNWNYNKHFRLMADIDDVTEMIDGDVFSGYFHGAGKKITVAIEGVLGCAFFAGVGSSGTIDSLIVDGYINVLPGLVMGVTFAGGGGIASGILNGGKIIYCVNNVIINLAPAEQQILGGIVPANYGGTIINCINNGYITGVDRIGGIAGENSGQIINCINTGKITATASGDNSIFSGVGGICGTIANSAALGISNCVNTGTVVGQGFVGGIIGLANGKPMAPTPITNCINYGYIKGTNAVGGIAGIMWGGIYTYVNISNCVNAGVVEGESDVGSITGKE